MALSAVQVALLAALTLAGMSAALYFTRVPAMEATTK